MPPRREVLLEGYTAEEILAAAPEELDLLVFVGEPIVFRIGSAELLGEFRRTDDRLVLELAHIDGGGEGVLPTLWVLARRYALREQLARIEWIVHAVSCPEPNMKLRRVLERRGFRIEELPGIGPAYHLMESVAPNREAST